MSKLCEMTTKFLHSTKKFVSLSYNAHGYGDFFYPALVYLST